MFSLSGRCSLSSHPLFVNSEPGEALSRMPLGFIDVGARGGAHDVVDPIADITAVLGFEPDVAECHRLMSIPAVYQPWAKFELVPVAVADKVDEATLHLLSANTNHSLLPPNSVFTQRYNMVKWLEIGKEKLNTDLMDNVVFSEKYINTYFGEFIKLDTQGTEYEVLKGSSRTLDERTVAIVTEVAFCELYQGQKLFSEVEMLLRSHGFSFYGFSKFHGRSCKLLDKNNQTTAERAFYADAVFFKDPLSRLPNSQNLSTRSIYALYTCALLLGYYDFALELASKYFAKEVSQLDNVKRLISEVSHLSPEQTISDLIKISEDVKAQPSQANIIVGGFVDRRRRLCNYDDVLNVSVLPKTL